MYLASAGTGFSLAQYTLGELALYEFLEEGKQTLHQAVAYMRTASELGHVAASVKLGILYADRRFSILSQEKSEFYFKLAVEQGYRQAGYYLARHKLFFASNQGELDAARRAAELEMTSGNDNAAYLLGEIYRRGLGVKPDPEKALEMYLRASEAGFASATYNAAVMFFKGEGTEPSRSRAIELLQENVVNGDEASIKLLERLEKDKASVTQ